MTSLLDWRHTDEAKERENKTSITFHGSGLVLFNSFVCDRLARPRKEKCVHILRKYLSGGIKAASNTVTDLLLMRLYADT
jgi:hypothetical protein